MPGKASAWRQFRKSDGRWYRCWREAGSRKQYKQLEHRWVWEMEHGPIPDGHEIHHENRDPTDNRPENLRCISPAEHDALHAAERADHVIGDDGVERRRCQRCQEYRPLAEFSKRTAGTFHGYCKPCQSDYQREWADHNRARKNELQREWARAKRAERGYVRGPYRRAAP